MKSKKKLVKNAFVYMCGARILHEGISYGTGHDTRKEAHGCALCNLSLRDDEGKSARRSRTPPSSGVANPLLRIGSTMISYRAVATEARGVKYADDLLLLWVMREYVNMSGKK